MTMSQPAKLETMTSHTIASHRARRPRTIRDTTIAAIYALSTLILIGSTTAENTRSGDTGHGEPAHKAGEGLERLNFLVGTWDVTAYDQGGAVQFQTTSTVRAILDGMVLEERAVAHWADQKWDIILMRSYDPYQNEYRMAAVDNITGLIDVYEGKFEGGTLKESNLGSGTFSAVPGEGRYFFRSEMERLSNDHFVLKTEHSNDDGKTWKVAGKYVYQRQQ